MRCLTSAGRPASAQLSPTTKSPPKTYDLDEEKDTVAEQLQQSPPSATAAAASAPSETQEEGKSEHPTSPQSDVEASDAKQQEGNDEEAKHEAPLDTNGATGPTSPLAAAPAPAGPSAEEAAAAGAARKAAKRKKYEPLVMVLGDDVIDQFVSTQWKDRVTALESVMRTVTARTKARKLTRSENNEYDEFLFTAVCKLLEKAIVDRIDAVALAALDLLEAALGGHIPHDFHRVGRCCLHTCTLYIHRFMTRLLAGEGGSWTLDAQLAPSGSSAVYQSASAGARHNSGCGAGERYPRGALPCAALRVSAIAEEKGSYTSARLMFCSFNSAIMVIPTGGSDTAGAAAIAPCTPPILGIPRA